MAKMGKCKSTDTSVSDAISDISLPPTYNPVQLPRLSESSQAKISRYCLVLASSYSVVSKLVSSLKTER
jgi:hypothetical protein